MNNHSITAAHYLTEHRNLYLGRGHLHRHSGGLQQLHPFAMVVYDTLRGQQACGKFGSVPLPVGNVGLSSAREPRPLVVRGRSAT